MTYDLAVHLDADDPAILELALGNIENYLVALEGKTPCRVTLVANAAAVTLFVPGNPHAAQIRSLSTRGVTFKMCANALRKHGLNPKALLEVCDVVPAGVVELVRLQDAGFAYVKP